MNTHSSVYDLATVERTFGKRPDSDCGVLLGAKLALLVVLADGASPAGREGLYRSMRRMGMSEAIVQEIDRFDPTGAVLADFIPPDVRPASGHARRLLYALLAGALGDGILGDGERRAIDHLAEHLSVPPAMVTSLRALVEMERAAHDLRLALFAEVLA